MNSRITTQAFFDTGTWTVTYVVSNNTDRHAAIIDPVLDYDFKSGNTSTASADRVVAYLKAHGLTVDWILETHAHADHLSGAHYLKEKVGGRIAIGENIRAVQSSFKAVFNLGDDFSTNGVQFDHLFKDGEIFKIGDVEAVASPSSATAPTVETGAMCGAMSASAPSCPRIWTRLCSAAAPRLPAA
jgi:glyoxylase-like metal-dependent hydrolase (beta-lactamase superfamily II)